MVSLKIDGPPVSWRAHAGFGRRSYNPRFKEKADVQRQIKAIYRDKDPIDQAVRVVFEFYMQIPRSATKSMHAKMLSGQIPHTRKPDIDNLNKFLCDCLKGIVIEDDNQVVEIVAKKMYGAKPHTLIFIESVK